ncbi:guanyl-nucleotide exchange factor [Pseudozyma hubeiensis SY62]|uniref:Guanyl-nucleotide exchange factor n=1 Tax=Pseudozyma hubeiensis (strain SY62) TaxID=1305764 RepID=R9PDK5_PSEHS|nr:guanyl-nucleotide exchange factor [Pseudozyma hubeiensis SY62]GAC99312.1 guanyl-nucleotide exchange factor [Pseudozyma hubeiensis SY62]
MRCCAKIPRLLALLPDAQRNSSFSTSTSTHRLYSHLPFRTRLHCEDQYPYVDQIRTDFSFAVVSFFAFADLLHCLATTPRSYWRLKHTKLEASVTSTATQLIIYRHGIVHRNSSIRPYQSAAASRLPCCTFRSSSVNLRQHLKSDCRPHRIQRRKHCCRRDVVQQVGLVSSHHKRIALLSVGKSSGGCTTGQLAFP